MSLGLDKSTWQRVTFGDVVQNLNETVKDAAAAGIDRVVAMEHMDPGELKINRWGNTADGTTFTRRLRPGQTLFGKRRAYQRKVAYAEFDAICSGDIYTFEADETRMLGEFLPFLVQSDPFFDHALNTSAGSLSPRTNWRDLANFEFELPPLEEQGRIAKLLWSMEMHRRNLLSLRSLLTTDESIDGLGRLLFVSQAKLWETTRFADSVQVSSGSFLPAKEMSPGTVPVYGGNGIAGYHSHANSPQNVVMIGRVGAYCGVVHESVGPSWVTDNALVVKRADGFRSAFLAAALRFARLNAFASQTAQPAVSAIGLAEAALSQPNLDSQDAYLVQRATIQRSLDGAHHELVRLTQLTTAVLDDVFGGN